MIDKTSIQMLDQLHNTFNLETRVEAHPQGNTYILIKRPHKKRRLE